MSLGSILSVARGALSAHQMVIQTTGHNIANVETPGYSRQRVELSPNFPQTLPQGVVGTGVVVDNVVRIRDRLLDTSYREEASDAAAFRARHDLLAAVEGVLGEPSEDGLAGAMDAFWSSWSELANHPTSDAARSVVRQRGATVAGMLNGFDARLKDLRAQTVVRVSETVAEINNLADQIGALNGRIVETEVGGKSANDLRDARDLAIDRLAKLGDVRTIENPDGSVQVTLGNNGLVDGVTVRHFRATDDGTTLTVGWAHSTQPMLPVGGAVAQMVEFVNADLVETRGRLDALARSLVDRVNDTHRDGQVFAPDGTASPAGDFFHPGDVADPGPPVVLVPVTAGNIRLSDDVLDSPSAIAASAAVPAPGQVAGPGNNEIALALAGFRTRPDTIAYVAPDGTPETGSFGGFYRDTASRLGARVKDVDATASVHETLATQADARRSAVSGVNLDEELTTLMRAQQAYAAAAKVITTAEEMLRTLVEMV